MKTKLGVWIYFLAAIFVFFTLPLQETKMTALQHAQVLYMFNGHDIYLLMSSVLYFWFDYLTVMLPLQGLLQMQSFLQIRQVALSRRIWVYLLNFYWYFLAFLVVKSLGLSANLGIGIISTIIFGISWWLLLIVLSVKNINRTWSTIIVAVTFLLLRGLCTIL
ncbi:hypothetical protein R078131_01209 [Convivina intestini]|nr:hypothetical protein R078131_01209 [Convivina intestini]